MTPTLEHIKQEVRALRPADRYDLWRDLSQEFDPLPSYESEELSIEAEWDQEIASRVKEVEDGTVTLISAEEADRRTAELFARLGLRLESAK